MISLLASTAASQEENMKLKYFRFSGMKRKIFMVTSTRIPKAPSEPFMISCTLGPVASAGNSLVLKVPAGVTYSWLTTMSHASP